MNFVFFFPDEMRAESVSCYGHPVVQMPNYDRVAGRAYALSSATSSTRCARPHAAA